MANTYRIKIFNRELNITTDQTLEYTQWLADKLNEDLAEIVSGVANMTLTNAAVLVALDNLDKAVKGEESAQNIRKQIKKYADDASEAQQKAAAMEMENEKLRRRIAELEKKLSGGNTQPAASKPVSPQVFVTKKQELQSKRNEHDGSQTSFFK